MNPKRFLLASIAVFVVFSALNMVIHGPILSASYEATMDIWRPDMMDLMWIMYITTALFSLLFVFIFIKGYENKGLMEGLRYGLLIGLIMSVMGFNQYPIYPVPFMMALQWFIYGTIQITLCGMAASLVYKK